MKCCRFLIFITATSFAQAPITTDFLAAHNAVRASLKIPPLTWSDQLAARAQNWANILLTRRHISHRPDSPLGENIFEIEGARATPSRVLDEWASESRDYDYASNKCSKVCGHYTQIVWASTKEVGCAVARDSKREIWVCNYDPSGNWIGKRPY